MWEFYCDRIAPMCYRTSWRPGNKRWHADTSVDWPFVLELIKLYPLDTPQRMLDQIYIIIDTLQES